jgi:uncharacterized protein (DUF2267 family)
MQYDEFVKNVRERANLNSNEEAVRAIEATLSTLAERLAGNEASNLASQLPAEIQSFLTSAATNTGTSFGKAEFIGQVAQKEGVDLTHALNHAQVVMWVLSEAVTRGEFNDLRQQLPQEYVDLFQYTERGLPNTGREAHQQPF